jgi:hypothetical protein
VFIEGPALPANTALQGLLISGTTYFSGGYTVALTVGQWNTLTFQIDVTADRVGVQLLLPPGASWTGAVWIDEVGW